MPISDDAVKQTVTFKSAFFIWLKVGLYSFGGPAHQIAVMHRLIVEERQWISEERFLHALNFCMLLPGPEAQQLAVYIGWLLHRVLGGIIAGVLFVLPGFFSILALSILYVEYADTTWVHALFYGIKSVVTVIVFQALYSIGSKALHSKSSYLIALGAFLAIFFINLPFPLIILTAGLIGFLGQRSTSERFEKGAKDSALALFSSKSNRRFLATVAIWLAVWLVPVAVLLLLAGLESIYAKEAVFFSKTAVVTFGGAYAVLAYIAQQAVQHYGWLESGEMLDGLGMAETTPGPLIQVVQFVGFIAAYRNPGELDPLLAGIYGSLVTTWVTFAPSFLWIFAGAPYIEVLRGIGWLQASLKSVTAAVVGVILNLSLWFALNALFNDVKAVQYSLFRFYTPVWPTFDAYAFLIMAIAFVMAFYWRCGILTLIAIGGCLGVVPLLLA